MAGDCGGWPDGGEEERKWGFRGGKRERGGEKAASGGFASLTRRIGRDGDVGSRTNQLAAFHVT